MDPADDNRMRSAAGADRGDGVVSHMHKLVELHGQPGWVAALTPLSVDGMIVADSTTLLAESRAGQRGGVLPWALLAAGSSEPGRQRRCRPADASRTVIATWPPGAVRALQVENDPRGEVYDIAAGAVEGTVEVEVACCPYRLYTLCVWTPLAG